MHLERWLRGRRDVAAGARGELTVPDLPAGTYRVSCTYHPQMEGAPRVPPAG